MFNRQTFIVSMLCILIPIALYAIETPLIFPQPQEIQLASGTCNLDENTQILIPLNASKNDIELAKFLTNDLVDKFYLPIQTKRTSETPEEISAIVTDTIDNPLIKEYCMNNKIDVTIKSPGKEGYVLIVEKKAIIIAGVKFYQLFQK